MAEILPGGGSYVGDEVLDCKGMTVLPGLHNLHIHLMFRSMNWPAIGVQTEYVHIVNAIRYMHKLMTYGYTSLRDVGCPYNISIKLREDINAGRLVGPNLTACGAILVPDQIAPPELEMYSCNPHHFPCNDPYLLRGAVRKQLADGADFIKILGCSAAPVKRGDGPLFYPDEMEELVSTAAREGTYLAIHTNSTESNAVAIAAEAHSIEHANFWTKENMDAVIAHGMKSTIVPTLHICVGIAGTEFAKVQAGDMRLAYDAGMLIGWGTDATEEMFMAAPGTEFTAREEVLGFSKMEILKQATINSAKINGTDDLRGSIKVGKRADFAIFDGRPDEDLSLFNEPPAYVIKDGQVVAREGFVKM